MSSISSTSSTSSSHVVPIEIAPETFWVGKREQGGIFFANPYLRRFRGKDAQGKSTEFNILIDPGSSSDFSTVHTKVASLIGGLDRLSAIFINHQDPDVGSSTSIITARFAPKAGIICSEDTWRLIVHLNLPRSRFVATEKFTSGLKLPTGHRLQPVPSPFCHFRGAVMLYDPETRVLFTGDLFGGLTAADAQGIWADESDWNGMRAFHQIYMPTNQALARAVAAIRKLDPAPEVIAPQHGRVIRGPLIQYFLSKIEKLQVGLDVMEEEQDKSALQAWASVIERVIATARTYMGAAVDAKLNANAELAETVQVINDRVTLKRLGKWSTEQVVETLSGGEPSEISGPIQVEAVMAAAEYNLPTPHIDIENGLAGHDVSLFPG
jgi:flavorubredoxin